ncbi:hypothetical protein FGO68_gene794 [Halteria grandinella]|uniref:Uncharacterized protein n=1 Tax=Halteria grandinella TaxID=5974 RepID=A0A8J8T4X5_HALGN|nr:hypothetical protein FGO68_gene794 [Halteria grandinella]
MSSNAYFDYLLARLNLNYSIVLLQWSQEDLQRSISDLNRAKSANQIKKALYKCHQELEKRDERLKEVDIFIENKMIMEMHYFEVLLKKRKEWNSREQRILSQRKDLATIYLSV